MNVKAALAMFPQLQTEDNADVRQLFEQAQVLHLPAHQPVFQMGSPCRNYLLVIEGSVRVHVVGESGREVTLYRVGKGDSCVLTTSCLLSQEAYPAAATTETEVTALALSMPLFERALDSSAVFRRFVFGNLGHRLAQVIHRMEDVALGAIDTRLARWLLDPVRNPQAIDITHEALALELGTAREVVSRHLKRFESLGWVRLSRGRITVLDAGALAHPIS